MGRAERGCIRCGAGEHAQHGRAIQVQEPTQQDGHYRAQEDNGRRQRVEPQPGLAQGSEEARTELQPDAEHKQNEPELLHELQGLMVDGFTEVADQDCCKQDAGRPQLDAPHPDAAQAHAGHAHEREDGDRLSRRVRSMQVE